MEAGRIARYSKSGALVNKRFRAFFVPALLTASDLMVHPARNEAAGNVLAEAAASGLPAVCTANGNPSAQAARKKASPN